MRLEQFGKTKKVAILRVHDIVVDIVALYPKTSCPKPQTQTTSVLTSAFRSFACIYKPAGDETAYLQMKPLDTDAVDKQTRGSIQTDQPTNRPTTTKHSFNQNINTHRPTAADTHVIHNLNPTRFSRDKHPRAVCSRGEVRASTQPRTV